MSAEGFSAIYDAWPAMGEVVRVEDWAAVPAGAEALWLHGDAVRDWAPLGGFAKLKRLTVCPTKKGQLAAIAAAAGVEQLELRHIGKEGLGAVPVLPRLTALKLDVFRGESLEGIERFAGLTHLEIWHAPKVASLEPLAALEHLEWLAISTPPSWDISRKTLKVESYAPLGELARLRLLALTGIEPRDRSLAALHRLAALERFEIEHVRCFKDEDWAGLARALPGTQGSWRPG